VHSSSATGVWTNGPRLPAPRRGVALLGAFAILLQALLFGWHHHSPPLSSRGAPAVLAAHTSGGDPTPVQADDNCQICFALSHHGAAAVDFLAAPVSAPVPLRLAAVETVGRLFRPISSFVPGPLLALDVGFIHLTGRRGQV
jgi:hypothetical protein